MVINFQLISYATIISLTAITAFFLIFLYVPESLLSSSTIEVILQPSPSWPITFSDKLTSLSGSNVFKFAQEFDNQDSAAPEIPPRHPNESERHFPYPFVSGDMFRFISDFIYDENEYKNRWHPDDIDPCKIVFVKNDRLGEFFDSVFPAIRSSFILITHNGDHPSPGPYRHYLNDERIFAWFGQNPDWTDSDKMHAIPIGIANSQWPHGDLHVWRRAAGADLPQWDQRSNLLFISWTDRTNPARRELKEKFRGFTNDTLVEDGDHDQFLQSLANSKFVLSPPGNGLDCHRHWEAILLGAVPIVQKSGLDAIFADAPAVVVDSFDLITEDWLRTVRPSQNYNRNVMWSNYWLNKIKDLVQMCRAKTSPKI